MVFVDWLVAHFKPGAGEEAGAAREAVAAGDWIEVVLPGDIHAALFAAGVVPDPHGEGGEQACAGIDTKEWWGRHRFEAAPAGCHRAVLAERLAREDGARIVNL